MTMDLTGISNVNEFYSHHYLDSLLEGDLKGLFSKWKEDIRTPDKRLAGLGSEYFKAKSNSLNENDEVDPLEYTQPFHYKLLEALGYSINFNVKYTYEGVALPLLNTVTRNGNEYLWMIQIPFVADDVNVLGQKFIYHPTSDLDEQKWFEGSVEEFIQEILRLDNPPRWLMLLAGQKVYLIDRMKWGQGKYLLFDLDEIFGRKQADTLKATAALLSKDALAPNEGNILHDELDEKSHKHAFSVSDDLKYGIRRAVELIGNEFIYYRSQKAKQGIYGDDELAAKLTNEALTYLYRLLFLFYAESRSEELNVVPMKSEEYRLGYSLESIRELEQVPLITDTARNSYYLHDSLNILFKIVNEGYGDINEQLNFETGGFVDPGFEMDGLQGPLFNPKQTPLLSSVKFRNFVLQEVIQLLSLSKEGGKQRGRISYAQLGINQLGAVYEGLLSYSGFFAQNTLFEVKPADVKSTDETGQSYFVLESEIDSYNDNEFVYITNVDGVQNRKKYEKGSFIFRLAGRDREKSASYYTPEVLTKSLVKYSLKELLKDKQADDILKLTVCEPAMGSGAFLNEAVNQLADAYLECKQHELSKTISAEDYSYEKQKVKAFIATNNIYGVDLNPTAAELAKVSLWLNTIYNGSKTPWFSAKLAVGNSLIGARRQFFNKKDLIDGKWHEVVPKKIPLNIPRGEEGIYHFLVPDKAMVAFDKDKVVKDIAKEHIQHMKKWRNNFTKKFDLDEINTLKTISKRIDELWYRHIKSRQRLFEITHEQINLWGQSDLESEARQTSIESKEEELRKIKESPTSPYQALKMVMDYWSAFWFWPIEKAQLLPTRDEFLLEISVILDSAQGFGPNIDDLMKEIPRFQLIKEVVSRIAPFHWELEFAEIFEKNQGFDLIIGNPPWLKLSWEEKGILSDHSPLINLRKLSAKNVADIRKNLISNEIQKNAYLREYSEITGQKAFFNSNLYFYLKGIQQNLYKCFMVFSTEICSFNGLISYLHLEGIYDDAQGGDLRKFIYPKLKYHFQYTNELKLFSEVHHGKKFGCTIMIPNKNEIDFYDVCNLLHPKTLDESFKHNGFGEVPGIKTASFEWELKGHNHRIIKYNKELLKIINKLYESSEVEIDQTKLLNIHSQEIITVLQRLSNTDKKLSSFKDDVFYTVMFDETNAQKDEQIIRKTNIPKNIESLVYSGPHFFVGNPLNKTPNEACKNNLDYSPISLLEIEEDYLPRSNYLVTSKGQISIPEWKKRPVTDYSRAIFRKMLDPVGQRTLIGAIIPKGPSHIHGCISVAFKDQYLLSLFSGITSSIILDFYVKNSGRSNLYREIYSFPLPKIDFILNDYIVSRVLRLNCVTKYYSELWKSLFKPFFQNDRFTKNDKRLSGYLHLKEEWSKEVAFRNDFERRQALVEIDVLTALTLGLNIDELLTIYRVQFPVLQKYEMENHYDQRGMIVPSKVLKYYKKQNGEVSENDPNLAGFIPPFNSCDREFDYIKAYEYFSNILNQNN